MSSKISEEPIGRQALSLPLLVAQRLIDGIVTGAIGPGTRITESAIADAHEVSRSTVREALTHVERVGLLRRIPRTGLEVLPINADYLVEIGEVRGSMLGLAARRAVERLTDESLSEFCALVDELERLAKDPETPPVGFGQQNTAIQQALLRMASSKFLDSMFDQLNKLTLWSTVVTKPGTTFLTAKRRTESARNWQLVAKAIREKDAGAAERAAINTLSAALVYLRDRVKF